MDRSVVLKAQEAAVSSGQKDKGRKESMEKDASQNDDGCYSEQQDIK